MTEKSRLKLTTIAAIIVVVVFILVLLYLIGSGALEIPGIDFGL